MKIFIPKSLVKIAERLPAPLYAVGGLVRNYLIGGTPSSDFDIAAALDSDEVVFAAKECGYIVVAEYKRTGTTVIFDGERKYEYTRFRTDFYPSGGNHKPLYTEFTDDISLDAMRRDFKCNAVYYDIKRGEIVDPLGGIADIKNKVLDTVSSPEKVFCSDGLRLMRLARFSGELSFTPTEEVLKAARRYAGNIRGVAMERIYEELKKILASSEKYPFSDKDGQETGLKVLEKIGVADILFPEITAGRGVKVDTQGKGYDLLESSFRAARFADKSVRLAAFLSYAGDIYLKNTSAALGFSAEISAKIASDILKRLKADKRTEKETAFLLKNQDFESKHKTEGDIRRFIAENGAEILSLLKLKQAKYSGETGDFATCPTLKRWQNIYEKMRSDGTPFSVKGLKISAKELIEIGFSGSEVGAELKALICFAVDNPALNDAKILREKAAEDFKLLSPHLTNKNG